MSVSLILWFGLNPSSGKLAVKWNETEQLAVNYSALFSISFDLLFWIGFREYGILLIIFQFFCPQGREIDFLKNFPNAAAFSENNFETLIIIVNSSL